MTRFSLKHTLVEQVKELFEESETIEFTKEDAKKIGDELNVNWDEVNIDEFTMGLNVELEHGTKSGEDTNVTNDDPIMTAKIALAHLKEMPDYYTRLKEMENK